MSKIITYKNVKENIEEMEGYKLLSKEYKNAKAKLKIQCPYLHIFELNWNKWQGRKRCNICKIGGKLSYNHVKEQIEKEGYKLLSKEYISWYSKLKIKCIEGHIYHQSYGLWKKRRFRCPDCAGNIKYSYNHVKEQIEKEGYKLLSKEYKNNGTKLKLQCIEGHNYKASFSCFLKGQRCPYCVGGIRLEYKNVKNQIESIEGYKLLSKEYKNNHEKLNIQCPKNHKFKMIWNTFKNNQRCPCCVFIEKSSKPEKEITRIIKKHIKETEIISNDRTQIINPLTDKNLELDAWIPSLRKAIEFNGDYWHSKPDVKTRDAIKKQQCKEKGINLLIINEKNWINNKNRCIEQIKEFLND